MSEAELQFLDALSQVGLINLILAGDRMQRGFTTENEKGVPVNSGITDVQMLSTPRLTTSIRSENYGMQHNLEEMEARLKVLWQKFQNAPWTEGSKLTFDTPILFKPIFTKTTYGLFGIGITTNGESAVETVKQYGKTVGIITDHPDDYSKYASSTINVVDPDTVQGDEYDYVVIDIAKFPKLTQFDALRYEYTLLSRARNGVLIVNSLGSVSTYEERADASAEVNERDEKGELTGKEIEDYKQWWNRLYSEDIFQGSVPAPNPQNPNPSSPGQGGGSNGGGQPGPGDLGGQSTDIVTFTFEGFDEEDFKKKVREQGSSIEIPFYTKSEQRKSDLDNYKRWHEVVENEANTAKLINTKVFIDALMTENALDELLKGKHSILNGLSYTDEQFFEYKKFIRNFMLDFLQLTDAEFKAKYSSNGNINAQLRKIFGGNKQWSDFIDALYRTVSEWGKTVYAVNVNGKRYFYYVVKQTSASSSAINYYAFPILIVDGFSANEGWLNLNTSKTVPMVMLSSAGFISRPLEETAGNYVEVSKTAYIPKTDPKTEHLDPKVKQFVNNSRGIAHRIVTSIFENTKAKPQTLLTRRMNGEVIEHIDQTSLDSNERISAVNRRFTAKKYIELARILRKLWITRNPLDDRETNLLKEYAATIYASITTTSDDLERVKQFKKIQLTSESSADNLVTALIRWYYNKGGSELEGFISKFIEWIAKKNSGLNKNLQQIQKGISLSLMNSSYLTDKYYVIPNEDGNFDVWISKGYGQAERIGTVPSTVMFNLDPKSFNVEQVVKNLIEQINKLDGRLSTYTLDDNQIKRGITTGEVSVGLTAMYTNMDTSRETSIRFYPPFDSSIVDLISDNAAIDPDFEEFLRKDSKFKYGFLVGFTGQNTTFKSDDWLECTPTEDTSDIIEILPPLFSIDSESRPTQALGLPSSLGVLDHKIEEDDKTKVVVNAYKDRDGNIYRYSFETRYNISKPELENLLGESISESSFKFTIIGIENGKITYSVNGKTYEHSITQDKVLELLNEMNVNEISSGTISKDTSGDYYLVEENGQYSIENKLGESSPGILIDYNDGNLIVLYNNQLLQFNNISEDIANKLNLNWYTKRSSPETHFIGNMGNEFYYYDSKRDLYTIVDDLGSSQNLKIVKIETIPTGFAVIFKNEDGQINKVVMADSTALYGVFEKENNKKPTAIPKVIASDPIIQVAKSKFKNLDDEDFNDPLLTSNPSLWAKQRAFKLGGWYVFKNNKFVQTNDTMAIFQFAQYLVREIDSSLDIQSIINDSDSSINIADGIISWSIDGRILQFKMEKSGTRGRVQFNFEPITSEAAQLWREFDEFLNTVANVELRNAMHTIEYSVVDPKLEAVVGDAYELLSKFTGDPFVIEYYDRFNGRLDENYCPI